MRFSATARRAGDTEELGGPAPRDDEGYADVLVRASISAYPERDRGEADVLGHRRGQLRRVARVARPPLGTSDDAQLHPQRVVWTFLHALHEYVQSRELLPFAVQLHGSRKLWYV